MPALGGIEQLRALIASGTRPGIAVSLDFTLSEVGDGTAVFTGTPGQARVQPNWDGPRRLCRDAARFGVRLRRAYEARGDSRCSTTLELKVAYHKTITDSTGPLRAEGRVVTFGRRVAFAEGRLVDAAGKLYASATSTLLIIEQ